MAESYGVTTLETQAVDNVLLGQYEAVDMPGTLLSGQNLTRGTVVGKVTASGKLKAYASGNNDGSENPVGIMARDTNATGGDVKTLYYATGVFNKKGLTGADANGIDKLAARGVIIKEGKD
ncbi:MAG: head decoration protein [Rhodocyclaceae bacterium]|nr:MAG: head decoration protein [Rhodocyclaceae bacterium]